MILRRRKRQQGWCDCNLSHYFSLSRGRGSVHLRSIDRFVRLNDRYSESAQVYLKGLLENQETEGTAIRIFVAQPGTPHAETCIAYCRPGEEENKDISVEYDGFRAWFEEKSIKYLEDAEVDYKSDEMGGQLTIKAPMERLRVGPDASLEDRINYILQNEINPGLRHGGMVSLVEVTEDMNAIAVWRRVSGLPAVDLTLKMGLKLAFGAAARACWCVDATDTVLSRTLL